MSIENPFAATPMPDSATIPEGNNIPNQEERLNADMALANFLQEQHPDAINPEAPATDDFMDAVGGIIDDRTPYFQG